MTARRDRNEPATFWTGWRDQFARPSGVRARQLDLFNVPAEPIVLGAVRFQRGWWLCSLGHRHRKQETANQCEAKRGQL